MIGGDPSEIYLPPGTVEILGPGKGLVGIIANDSARYSLFSSCVTELEVPAGSKKEWIIGGDWCGARNDLARRCLEGDYQWLWFMDDDHVFAPTILNALIAHRKPLVVPVCLTRVYPFVPVTYTERIPDAEHQYLPLPLEELPESGLVELEAGGCAGMLIRREVLEAVEPPWFEYGDRSEDIMFCEKAKAAGFEIYCDLSARLGHITTAVVWPAINEGKWAAGFTIGRDLNLFVPLEQAGTSPPRMWRHVLRRVEDGAALAQYYVQPEQSFEWDPGPAFWDESEMQWFVDKGDGIEESAGEPFRIMLPKGAQA